MQVSYCSKECQKTDWSRHRDFCKAAARIVKRGGLRKDTFAKLIQSVLSNPCLSVLLKNYASDLLQLRREPKNGLRKNIVFTCTFVQENVGDAIDLPNTWVLQLLHVAVEDFVPSSMHGLDIEKELSQRAVFFEDPNLTSELVQQELYTYKTTTNAAEKTLAGGRLASCDIPVVMTFKSDIEGATSTVSSVERLQWVLLLSSIEVAEPLLWLL